MKKNSNPKSKQSSDSNNINSKFVATLNSLKVVQQLLLVGNFFDCLEFPFFSQLNLYFSRSLQKADEESVKKVLEASTETIANLMKVLLEFFVYLEAHIRTPYKGW